MEQRDELVVCCPASRVERLSERLARLGMADHRPAVLSHFLFSSSMLYVFKNGDPCDHI
jgi:hypothetical protein